MQLLVGGEPARLVLDTIRGFRLSVSGRVTVHEEASPVGLAALGRAYEVVEVQVIVDAERCTAGHVHRTVDDVEFHHLVLREIVRQAKQVLGETHVLDPIWECHV